MSDATPRRTAIVRSLWQALASGGLAFFTVIAQSHDWWLVASMTGVAVFTVLAGRGGVEGAIDSNRARQQGGGS